MAASISIQKNNKRLLLLPLLPVLFFFLHSIALYTDLVIKSEVFFLFIAYSMASYILFLFIKKIAGIALSPAICTGTILTTELLFYGIIQDALIKLKKPYFLSNSLSLLGLFFLVVIPLILLAKKKKYSLHKLNRYLGLLFSVLIVYEIVIIGITMVTGKNARAVARKMVAPVQIYERGIQEEKPDIHYLVFDSYTNPASLKQYWKYDNEIVPWLESKGFFVPDSSFSNYKSTPFSISSILNLQYLKNAGPYLYSNSSNFLRGRYTYLNNILYTFLLKQGYHFSNYSQLETEELVTGFGFLGVEKPAKWLRKQTVERVFLDPWIMGKITTSFRKKNEQPRIIRRSMASFREYNEKAVNHILSECQGKRQETGQPVFSFTHFMLPHDPYQLEETGKPVKFPVPGGGDMNGYLNQLKYTNSLIRKITECLLSDTTRKKIIIIQGDHGYRHYNNAGAREHFSALNCIYFYNGDYSGLTEKFSHVNTFRIVLNKFFDGRLPLLADSVFLMEKEYNKF